MPSPLLTSKSFPRSSRCFGLTALSGLLLLATGASDIDAGARAAAAQDALGPAHWRSYASGDEILSLATAPDDPDLIWAGTEGGGLVRWNVRTGEHEQSLRPQQPGLTGNRVYSIAFDDVGNGWLATDGGVSRVPAQDGLAWRAWGASHGLPEVPLRSIAHTPDGRVWAGSTDSDPGLFYLDPGAEQWQPVVPDDELRYGGLAADGPGGAPVVALAADERGRLWVAHGRSGNERPALSLLDEQGVWRHVLAAGPRDDPALGPRSASILALWIDARDGALWAGTWARGLSRWDGQSWQHFDEEQGLCGRNVTALTQAPSGAMWAACTDSRAGQGAAVLEVGSTIWQHEEAASGPWTGAIAYAGGRAWLGSNGPGPGGRGLVDASTGAELRTGEHAPAANEVTAIAFGPEGVVWVGTRGSGLLRYDGRTWRHFDQSNTDGRLAGDVITDLALRGDALWVAAAKSSYRDGAWRDGGISILDAESGAPRRLIAADGQRLPDGDVGSLAIDDEGIVWIGIGLAAGGPGTSGTTHHGEGLVRHDPDEGTWQHVRATTGGAGLAGNTVVDVTIDGPTVWAATSFHHDPDSGHRAGGGVSRGDRQLDGWQSWRGGEAGLATFSGTGAPGSREAFVTGDMRSIAVTQAGLVYAGSYVVSTPSSLPNLWPYADAALSILEDGAWRPLVFNSEGWVSAITEDGRGKVWVGTTRGHDEAEEDPAGHTARDRASSSLRVLDGERVEALLPVDGGLAGRGVSALAYDSSTGELWVGTENDGLSVYRHPDGPRPTSGPPTAVATRPPSATPRAGGEATPTRPGPTRPPTRTPAPNPTRTTEEPGDFSLWLPILQPQRVDVEAAEAR